MATYDYKDIPGVKDPANISGQRNRTASIPSDQLAAKGGKKTTGGQLANFLATDKVPPTIFGIPVVTRREDYTEADLRFFSEHPEAGGYYSMGDEDETPEDGSKEGAPVQASRAGNVRKPYPGSHNNPGNVKNFRFDWDGVDIDRSPVGGERLLYFETPQAGLNAKAKVSAMILRNLASSGEPASLENWAKIYAPTSENDTEKYIRDIRSMTGFDRKTTLDLDNDANAIKFMRAVIQRESGKDTSDWFTDDEYKTAARFLREKESFMTELDRTDLPRYNRWFRSLPKNLRWTEDYDLPGVWLEKLGKPDRYVPSAQNGHLSDYGKKPNHITFSDESKWHDPSIPERTGGHWERIAGDNPRFWPGPGNKATDEELEAYFEKYEPDYVVMPKDDYHMAPLVKTEEGGK